MEKVKLTHDERLVWQLIPYGRTNARTHKDLLPSMKRREWCAIIQSLRKKGKLIGASRSGRAGYYKICSEEERRATLAQYQAQVKEELAIIAHLEKADMTEIIEEAEKQTALPF